MKQLVVVSAGLSQPSSTRLLADRLATATTAGLRARRLDSEVQVLELRDTAHDVTTRLVNGYSSPELDEALERLATADGAIVVTPVFAASFSGLFKSFFDLVEPDALTGLPILLGATGGSERHSLVLDHAVRPLFGYLRADVVPTAVYAATADWGTGAAAGSGLTPRVQRAADELAERVERSRPRVARDPFAFVAAGFDPTGVPRSA